MSTNTTNGTATPIDVATIYSDYVEPFFAILYLYVIVQVRVIQCEGFLPFVYNLTTDFPLGRGSSQRSVLQIRHYYRLLFTSFFYPFVSSCIFRSLCDLKRFPNGGATPY